MTPPEVPDYALLRRIGTGAYGEVWLGRSTATGALRAIKIVHRDRFTDARPFEREFDGLRRFEEISRAHPSQLALFHVGRAPDGSHFYYVMELADPIRSQEPEARSPKGILDSNSSLLDSASYSPRTLRADLEAGRLPAARVLELGLALAEALDHLHGHGLVHRDIKPSNIIFVAGRPKLADIGLVTDASDQCSIVGTEGYLPPEGPGTPAADVFALGKVLYEALTGLDRRRYPEMPAEIRGWPDRRLVFELNEVLLKACAAAAGLRYASAGALLADLRHLAEGGSVKRQRAWQQGRRVGLQAAAVTALAIAGWLALGRFKIPPRAAQAPAVSAPAGVFVLPFRQKGTNALPDGMRGRVTDAFINSLKQLKGVTVAQRRSALGKLPVGEARAEAARLFGVRYVLEGALTGSNGLALDLTLHETGRDRPTWTQRFTGNTNRLIELEDHAIRTLAAALSVPFPPEASEQVGLVLSNNLAAWRLVEQAEHEFNAFTRTSLDAAIEHYNEAIQRDSDYLQALVGKASFYREMTLDRRPGDCWSEVRTLAEHMIQIDPTSNWGQYFRWCVQFLYEWNWPAADQTFQERRSRGVDWPVMTALYLRVVGRTNEARLAQARVSDLDQRDLVLRNHAAAAAYYERDYPRVLSIVAGTQAIAPGTVFGLDWQFHAHYQLGELEQALKVVQRRRAILESPLWRTHEACVLARLGRRAEAERIIADLEVMSAHRYVDAYPLAWAHLALGNKVTALKKLRQACLERSEYVVHPDFCGGLRTDPKLDELRDEPEFQELLKLARLDVWPIPEWKPGLR